MVVSGLSEKNREKLLMAGAEDYLEKAALIPDKHVNLLPQILVDTVCRINRPTRPTFLRDPYVAGIMIATRQRDSVSHNPYTHVQRCFVTSPRYLVGYGF